MKKSIISFDITRTLDYNISMVFYCYGFSYSLENVVNSLENVKHFPTAKKVLDFIQKIFPLFSTIQLSEESVDFLSSFCKELDIIKKHKYYIHIKKKKIFLYEYEKENSKNKFTQILPLSYKEKILKYFRNIRYYHNLNCSPYSREYNLGGENLENYFLNMNEIVLNYYASKIHENIIEYNSILNSEKDEILTKMKKTFNSYYLFSKYKKSINEKIRTNLNIENKDLFLEKLFELFINKFAKIFSTYLEKNSKSEKNKYIIEFFEQLEECKDFIFPFNDVKDTKFVKNYEMFIISLILCILMLFECYTYYEKIFSKLENFYKEEKLNSCHPLPMYEFKNKPRLNRIAFIESKMIMYKGFTLSYKKFKNLKNWLEKNNVYLEYYCFYKLNKRILNNILEESENLPIPCNISLNNLRYNLDFKYIVNFTYLKNEEEGEKLIEKFINLMCLDKNSCEYSTTYITTIYFNLKKGEKLKNYSKNLEFFILSSDKNIIKDSYIVIYIPKVELISFKDENFLDKHQV